MAIAEDSAPGWVPPWRGNPSRGEQPHEADSPSDSPLRQRRRRRWELGRGRARERLRLAPWGDGLARLDGRLRILSANPSLGALLGRSSGALAGHRLLDLVAPEDRSAWEQHCGALLAGRPRRLCLALLGADGERQLLELQCLPRRDRIGQLQGTALLVREGGALIAARRERERLLRRDPLTGLANELSTRHFLAQHLAERSGIPLALLWLDLDGFRRLNHSHGRSSGDRLLCAVADHLRGWCRRDDWIARLGGDEFLVIRPAIGEEEAWAMASELQRSLAGGVSLPRGPGPALGFCAGVSLYPQHGRDGETLLRQASTALGRAHDSGQGLVFLYEPAFTDTLRHEMGLEGRLRRAIAAGGLRLVYQPQVDRRGHLIGIEALARWRDGERGEVSPERFIPLAERSGLIQDLGRWVLEEACAQQRRWQRAGLRLPPMAVNVSPRQLLAGPTGMSRLVTGALERHGLDPRLLELEITESGMLPIGGVGGEIERLAALGVTVAIDDFGSGYSSLASLQRLPIHKLKIDQTFTADLLSSDSARLIMRASLSMARQLGLRTLVEGVETAEQADLLAQMGCDGFQGFHFSRPLEVDACARLLASGAPLRG